MLTLHCALNIASNKQPWCMVQGQVDEKNCLLFGCGSDKVIFMYLPKEEVKATMSGKDRPIRGGT